MKKLDIKLQVEGLGSDLIYEGRGGSGWSEKRGDQSPLWKGLVRYNMMQGIAGRIIKFDTELLRKGYVRVGGGGGLHTGYKSRIPFKTLSQHHHNHMQ